MLLEVEKWVLGGHSHRRDCDPRQDCVKCYRRGSILTDWGDQQTVTGKEELELRLKGASATRETGRESPPGRKGCRPGMERWVGLRSGVGDAWPEHRGFGISGRKPVGAACQPEESGLPFISEGEEWGVWAREAKESAH